MSQMEGRKKWLPFIKVKEHSGDRWRRELGQRGQAVSLHLEVETSYMSTHRWALKAQMTWKSTPSVWENGELVSISSSLPDRACPCSMGQAHLSTVHTRDLQNNKTKPICISEIHSRASPRIHRVPLWVREENTTPDHTHPRKSGALGAQFTLVSPYTPPGQNSIPIHAQALLSDFRTG